MLPPNKWRPEIEGGGGGSGKNSGKVRAKSSLEFFCIFQINKKKKKNTQELAR